MTAASQSLFSTDHISLNIIIPLDISQCLLKSFLCEENYNHFKFHVLY